MTWRPWPPSMTDSPQRVNPGSTPITRTRPSSVNICSTVALSTTDAERHASDGEPRTRLRPRFRGDRLDPRLALPAAHQLATPPRWPSRSTTMTHRTPRSIASAARNGHNTATHRPRPCSTRIVNREIAGKRPPIAVYLPAPWIDYRHVPVLLAARVIRAYRMRRCDDDGERTLPSRETRPRPVELNSPDARRERTGDRNKSRRHLGVGRRRCGRRVSAGGGPDLGADAGRPPQRRAQAISKCSPACRCASR